MEATSKSIGPVTKCKNCGCSCSSNYCPDCGQSVLERRLENKSFFIGIISGLTRINKGFLFTAWHLLVHPWKVIRDYIRCRRVRYVAPVSMLILVCFISALAGALISLETHPAISDMSGNNISVSYRALLYAGNVFLNNTLVQNLTIYIPALLAIPIVYRNHGAARYNLAEYLAAMMYMACSFLLFDITTLPVSFLSETAYSYISTAYSIAICSVGMFKAFPIASVKQRVGYFLLFLFLVVLIYLLLLIIFGAAIGLGLRTL